MGSADSHLRDQRGGTPDEAGLQLPAHLSERLRVLSHGKLNPSGCFVLYWMHHAVRAHENPALDVALSLGNRYRLPVLVYQGLGGRHPYNSDRHHTFILQGCVDVHGELARRDIAYVFHKPRQPFERSPLRRLARRAAAVVVEDFPVAPFTRWVRNLAGAVEPPVLAVDCCCLVPMRWHNRAYERAYQFRTRTHREYEDRLRRSWPEVLPSVPPFRDDPGFDPLDLENPDIAAWCAACEIDHAVGPVPGTVGGTQAGYARWERFKAEGLADYARLRNDPTVDFPQGVSRLSPYLHYGYVSPFRIAREAAESGAEKFLDELLVWRELAHNFCFCNAGLGVPQVLPTWARRTLERHEGDRRPAQYNWERLARGQTGDPLWDAAQKSLLTHGELHNNVRMTWGKALLSWTRSAAEAFRLMVDLNHRYALDGSDPNSYGGILWCLGLFDRPFTPETPIYGAVRTRSTRDHAERIDLAKYRSKVAAPRGRDRLRVAVVGAGMSGLFAARVLADHGIDVRVYEKSRGTGGRLATRRIGELAFDIGAQYFTVRDERFRRYVDAWVTAGLVQPWEGRVRVYDRKDRSEGTTPPVRYVGVPRMTTIARHLADGLNVSFETRVAQVRRSGSAWRLVAEAGTDLAPCDVVVLAIPPAQAAPFLATVADLAGKAASVVCRPCWAVMVAFDHPLELPFDGAFLNADSLSWAARNNSKPDRPKQEETWVLHATAEWSETHLEEDAAEVAGHLLREFFRVVGLNGPKPALLQAHRWRYAKARTPLTNGCLWDPAQRIGACGDWCAGSRVEGAALSGMAVAGRVLGSSVPDRLK